jgi:hypothetical protein
MRIINSFFADRNIDVPSLNTTSKQVATYRDENVTGVGARFVALCPDEMVYISSGFTIAHLTLGEHGTLRVLRAYFPDPDGCPGWDERIVKTMPGFREYRKPGRVQALLPQLGEWRNKWLAKVRDEEGKMGITPTFEYFEVKNTVETPLQMQKRLEVEALRFQD